jgi:hypothetical protein
MSSGRWSTRSHLYLVALFLLLPRCARPPVRKPETRNPKQDGDIESVTQSKRVVKIKLETAPKLILIIKKPNGIAV